MKHKMWFEEQTEILYLHFGNHISATEINELFESAKDLLNGRKTRNFLIDLSRHSGIINKDVRRIINRRAYELQMSKYAFVGADVSARMVSRVLLITIGQTKVARFFHSCQDAITWLKQER